VQFQHDFMLDVTAVLDGLKESLQVALTQQLRQPMFFLRLRRPSFRRACWQP
jgi:hypothetical protein